MRSFSTWLLFLLGTSVVQSLIVFPSLNFFTSKPDITLIGVIFFALIHKPFESVMLGAYVGFFQDLLSAAPTGFHTLVMACLGGTVAVMSGDRFLVTGGLLAVLWYVVMGTFFEWLFAKVILLLFLLSAPGSSGGQKEWITSTLSLLLNLLLAAVGFAFVRRRWAKGDASTKRWHW